MQLRLYALFMQATSGNASGSRPGFSDFEARSRWISSSSTTMARSLLPATDGLVV